jgi:subtilisin family serine protease
MIIRVFRPHLRVTTAAFLSYLLVILTCVPFSTSAGSFPAAKILQEVPAAHYRDTELLVRFRAGVSEQVKEMILAVHGVRRKRQLAGESSVARVELPAGRDVRSAALELMLNPQVEFAEPNFLISKDDLRPNDAQFDAQWALRNTGQNGGHYGSDINAATAWKTTTGSVATVVAVIDSGVDFMHPDLTNNQWTNSHPEANGDLHGWDFITESGEIKDEQGHGTAVAGIIAAEGNNFLGVTGVMWRASLMSLRVLDNTGTGYCGRC